MPIRLSNEMVRRRKQVDVLFFKDMLCGSRLRPCPKYPAQAGTHAAENAAIAPDVIFFPQRAPSSEDPEPSVHTLETLRLPHLILRAFDVAEQDFDRHIWYAQIQVVAREDRRLARKVTITHQGKIVDQSTSRSWKA